MEGDEAVRFCGKCRKNVYNVAQLPRAEAVALIERAEGRVCMPAEERHVLRGKIAVDDPLRTLGRVSHASERR